MHISSSLFLYPSILIPQEVILSKYFLKVGGPACSHITNMVRYRETSTDDHTDSDETTISLLPTKMIRYSEVNLY